MPGTVMNRLLVVLVALVLVVLAPERAAAHDLRMTLKVFPDEVRVEAGFTDDTPAQGARVVIADAAGNEVASGKTDETGVCRLPKLRPGTYVAWVTDPTLHRDEVRFEVVEEAAWYEFTSWRLDKRLGLAIGLGGILAVTAAYWWLRLRRPAA